MFSEGLPRTPLGDGFVLDSGRGCVLKDGRPVHLRPLAYQVLHQLAAHPGQLVSKDALIAEVWRGRAVTDGALGKCIEEIREALGDAAKARLQNIHGRGYLFDIPDTAPIGPVSIEPVAAAPAGRSAAEHVGASVRSAPRLVRPAALLLAAAALFAVWFSVRSDRPAPASTDRLDAASAGGLRSLAVLPFKPIAMAARDEALEVGMADAIITRLGGLENVVVRPISLVRPYAGMEQDPIRAGQRLGVNAVLDGSIQQETDRLRVTVRLLEIPGGRMLWGDVFDEAFTGIFAVQDSISRQVASALAWQLTGAELQHFARRDTKSVEAYQNYLKGRLYWYRFPAPGYEQARGYFEQALALDPDYAQAYSGLADYHGFGAATGVFAPSASWPLMEAAATKAASLNDRLGDVQNSLAGLRLYAYRDYEGAEHHFKRGIEVSPSHAEVRHHYGRFLSRMGRTNEALVSLRRAQELEPLSLRFNRSLGIGLWEARRYEAAIDQLRKTLEIDASFGSAHEMLGHVFEQQGQHAEAVAEWRQGALLSGDHQMVDVIDRAHARGGFVEARRSMWQTRLDRLNARIARGEYVAAADLARAHTSLGQLTQAMYWVTKAVPEQNGLAFDLLVDPQFDALSSQHGFADVVARIKAGGFPSFN